MGNLEKIHQYNRLEDKNHPKGEDFAGPYVFPKLKDFQKRQWIISKINL